MCAWVTGCSHVAPPAAQAPIAAAPVVATPIAPAPALTSEADKTLYALGLVVGRNLSNFDITPSELLLVERGIHDAALRDKPLVELDDYGPKVNKLGRARSEARAALEKERGRVYATRLAGEPDTQLFTSGLVLRTLSAGSGDTPNDGNQVKVSYRGTLVDGTEFDSSFKRNEPATFPLRNVIPCWTEALQHVRVGGRARLVCPSHIAYGNQGRPPTIPGGATLTFEVELLEIVKAQSPPPPPVAKPKLPSKPLTPPTAQPAWN